MAATGVLLINLGSPDAPEPGAVRRYLREFLGDPMVLDMNPIARWFLLNLVILPKRPKKTALAYAKIWTHDGSPLVVHGLELAPRVGALLGPSFQVEVAMRYGRPSIADVLARLETHRLIVVPLYPQFSPASTGTTVAAVRRAVSTQRTSPVIDVVPAFYDHPAFIRAFIAIARPVLDAVAPDHVVMSFHGLPERHVRKADPHCLATRDCCLSPDAPIGACYRAQCLATSRALAHGLHLEEDAFSVAFQSRLGRERWLAPHTIGLLAELAGRGMKRLCVLCPAFVTDCLETLEEIGMRGRDIFIAAGGKELHLVPALNAQPVWAEALAGIISEAAERTSGHFSRADRS